MSLPNEFITQADAYARFRPNYPDELFTEILALCIEKETAWDVGTGSGQAAVALASHFKHFFASDVDINQLEQATPHSNIHYLQCKAEQSPLTHSSINLITVAQALHWFSFEDFFSEVHRVLKPQGVLVAWTYSRCQLAPGLDEVLINFYKNIVGPYWPTQRHWVDEAYDGIKIPLKHIEIPNKVLRKNWSLEHLIGYVSSWSAVTHYRRTTHHNPLPKLAEELQLLWGNRQNTQPIEWILTIKAGRKCSL